MSKPVKVATCPNKRILALIDEAIEEYEREKREHPISRVGGVFGASHKLDPVSR